MRAITKPYLVCITIETIHDALNYSFAISFSNAFRPAHSRNCQRPRPSHPFTLKDNVSEGCCVCLIVLSNPIISTLMILFPTSAVSHCLIVLIKKEGRALICFWWFADVKWPIAQQLDSNRNFNVDKTPLVKLEIRHVSQAREQRVQFRTRLSDGALNIMGYYGKGCTGRRARSQRSQVQKSESNGVNNCEAGFSSTGYDTIFTTNVWKIKTLWANVFCMTEQKQTVCVESLQAICLFAVF